MKDELCFMVNGPISTAVLTATLSTCGYLQVQLSGVGDPRAGERTSE